MRILNKADRGFGLVEILVTLGVLTVGVVGVSTLHSKITEQSQDNKARAEAMAVAQSRIEQMRNFTSAATSSTQFDALYPVTQGFANPLAVTGINAAFTRTESITGAGEVKSVTVNVGWSDSDGDPQSVNLQSDFNFVLPRSIGDASLESAPALVDAPTGRARLGEGTLPQNAEVDSNGDGTGLYNDNSGDLKLVSGEQIVLTLAEACQTDSGECIDFVKIKGTIYIDQDTQNNLDPGEVFVVASDAAFCARHYTINGVTYPVTPTTTSSVLSTNGDYMSFDYTCYLGGGWHGNVGIILQGGAAQTDKMCVGDPLSTWHDEEPVIATRRVYRGMLYKHDLSTDSDREEVPDDDGEPMVRYYSQGIGDSVELPVPNTTQRGHDFVIGSMAASDTEGSKCITEGLMMRSDSRIGTTIGALFEGVPSDFICLNEGYLDSYDTNRFGHEPGCDYDPSDPPSSRHIVSGILSLTATDSAANAVLANGMLPRTSDGPSNCLVSTFVHNGTAYVASYECDVYDWGLGWNGFIEAQYDASQVQCSPRRVTLSALTTNDTAGNDITNCNLGTYAVYAGNVTASGNRKLTGATMTGGACTVAANGLSYQCISNLITVGQTWSGTVQFTSNSGVICGKPPAGYSYSNQGGGNYPLNLTLANNNNNCP